MADYAEKESESDMPRSSAPARLQTTRAPGSSIAPVRRCRTRSFELPWYRRDRQAHSLDEKTGGDCYNFMAEYAEKESVFEKLQIASDSPTGAKVKALNKNLASVTKKLSHANVESYS